MPPVAQPPSLQALAALDRGLPGLADRIAGDATDANPKDAAAWNARGKIALAMRRPDKAIEWFRRAMEADARFKPAAKNLRDAEQLPEPPRPRGKAYLVILPWGQGFFSDVDMALGGLLLAEMTQRTAVVHWGPGSLFRDEGPDPMRDGWSEFFEALGDAERGEVFALDQEAWFPPYWNRETIRFAPPDRLNGPNALKVALLHFGRAERVCVHDFHTGVVNLLDWLPVEHRLRGATVDAAYRDLARVYLKPRRQFLSAAEEFAARHFAGASVLAVHARGTDKYIEDEQIAAAHGQYHGRIDEFLAGRPSGRVFLMTDSVPLLEEYRARYGERLIVTDAARDTGSRGVHYLGLPGRAALGREVLLDALIATRCDAFLGYGMSNVSCFVRCLKDWNPGACELIGRVLVEVRK